MSPDLESRVYTSVRRAVLWGQEKAEIFKMLQVNGVTGEAAEAMFRRARGERIAVLRNEAVRAAVKGALLLAGGVGLFCVFWFGVGAINRGVIVISGLMAVRGVWLSIGGVTDLFLAPTKEGSVLGDDQ